MVPESGGDMPLNALSIVLASTAASLALDLLTHPLDTIKTRVQSREYADFLKRTRIRIWSHPRIFKGLYQGAGSVILASLPTAGAFFVTYEYAQSGIMAMRQRTSEHSPASTSFLDNLCAASIAEGVACLVYAPADALKHNAQMIEPHHGNAPGIAVQRRIGVISNNATSLAFKKFSTLKQLWGGYAALLAHSLPLSAIQMPLYEALRHHIAGRRLRRSEKDSSSDLLLSDERSMGLNMNLMDTAVIAAQSAGIAGAIASILTAPMDIVTTRIMIDAPVTSEPQGKRIVNVVREIVRTEGLKGLFRGCGINCSMIAVGSGLYFGLYEAGKFWLNGTACDGEEL